MIAKCEAEIKKYKKVIVSPKLDKLFKSERKEFNLADYYFPFTYLLGQKDGVYTDAVLLHGHHGCSEFQTIQSTIIFKAYAQLVKKGLLVNGMCRIGKFANYSYHNIRELGFHHNGDVMLLISINANHIWSHIFGNDYQTTRVKEPYIVAKRKKGGDKYAKRKE